MGGLCNRRRQDAVGRDEKGCGMNTGKKSGGSAQKTACFQGMLPLGPHG